MMLHHLFFIGFDRRTVMGCMSLDIFRLSSTIFDHECDLEPRVFFYGYDPMIRTR